MAAIHDLIAQIGDERLRQRLATEWARATRERMFGLVFEDHLPELLPLPKARPRKGDLVAPRGGSPKDLWRVRGAKGGRLQCVRPQAEAETSPEATAEFELAEVMVVREFGEPIFPALVPVDMVANGSAHDPWHTLIEADNYHALQLLESLYAGQVDCIYIDPPYNTGARDWKYNNDYVDKNDQWRHSKWLAFMQRRLWLAKGLLNPASSVLIVLIDEREHLRLGLLLEQMFPNGNVQMISTLINPASVARGGGIGRSDEYAFFVTIGSCAPTRLRLIREWVSSRGRTHKGKVEASDMDIERLFQDAGRVLTNGLHKTYWEAQAERDSSGVKVELIVLCRHALSMTAIEDAAESAFNALYDKYKKAVSKLPEAKRRQYDRLRLATDKPADVSWSLPDSIDWRRTTGESPLAAHLFVDATGHFACRLVGWEPGVLAEELARGDVAGWLRNQPHKPWSLEIPYETGGEVRPMFPDFVVVRKVGEQFLVDILEPHDPSRDDNVDKARGLARFAERHGALFGRIQLIRKRKAVGGAEQFVRLEINRMETMQKLLLVGQASQLDALFDGVH